MKLETNIAAVAVAVCLVIAQQAVGQTNQVSTNQPQTKPTLPSKITLNDGRRYSAATLIRVEPDGLFVKYIPDKGGEGITKLRFANLPLAIQQQFRYNTNCAAAYELEQAQARIEYQRRQRTEDEINAQYRAELAKIELQAAKDDFEMELKLQTLQAQQKAADAAMIQALNPPSISIINQNVNSVSRW